MLPNVVLFQAQDALNQSSLWETNGTASGTFELAPAGANSLGLSPTDITVLGVQVLFAGVNSSGDVGLWTSDGTAAGTVELTSIAGAGSAGVAPADLTVFGSDALFSGINASGQTGLWITNGTASGTYELSGIAGAASVGIQPSDLTVFNGKALFAGSDAAGHLGLWVTNGAVAGTQELTEITGASTTELDPSDMVVFNNEVLFNGVDANGLSGLWVTDGSVSGTHELVPGAGGASDPAGLNPTDITVLNGEILFSGLDASGDMGLWVSNGTAAGTHELTGITGADSSGLAPSDLTVLNGEILFRGLDQAGQAELWITDGTVAGTHELTGIAGASTTGIGLDPSGFAVYGGVALFSGYDTSGNLELWQTNGSVAGTTEIGPVSGSESMGLSPTDLTAIGMVGPVLTAGANVSYVTGAAPVTLDAALSVADATAVSLSAATVSISAGFVLGDTLSVGSPQTGIVSQYNAATGVLTLSGSASLAAYQTELNSISYASANATTSSRTITWSLNDGVNASSPTTSHVSVSRLPPVVTAGASVSYVAGATPVALDAGLALADAAAVSLSAATVSISAGFVQGDTLSVGSPQTGIVSQYNAATGVLTLSGSASLAVYQTELDSITYASANATTSGRTILWSVNDGVNASAPVTSSVSVSRIVPVVTAGASVSYVAGGAPVALDAGLALADAAAASLSAATVSISAGFVQGDILSAGSPQAGVTSSYNAATGVLTLSGAASLAVYQAELNSVTYASPNATPSSRTITWSVNDGVNASNPVTSSVSVSRIVPVVTGAASVSYVAGGAPVALDAALVVSDAAAVSLSAATVSISAGFVQGDALSVGSPQTGIASQYNATTGVLSLSGAASLAAYQTELNSITYASANATPSSRTITWSVNDGVNASSPVTSSVSVSSVPSPGSSPSDPAWNIMWQNTSGQVAIWELNGTNVIGSGVVGPNPGPSWNVVGTGDFYGNGLSDALFQNTSGQVAIWELNGTNVIGSGVVGLNPAPSWKAIGTGDFNDDGHSDILFQNTNGQPAIWEMNGTNVISDAAVGPNPGPGWNVVGTGDFNDDGHSDILFQNTSGQVAIWEMNGTNVIGSAVVGPNPGAGWSAVGTGDFNGDGHSDILFQNTSGQVAIWEMNGTNVIGSGVVGPNPGPSWSAVGTGDYNNDGHSDILFQNTSGQVAIWEMNGTNVIASGVVGPNPGTSWLAIKT